MEFFILFCVFIARPAVVVGVCVYVWMSRTWEANIIFNIYTYIEWIAFAEHNHGHICQIGSAAHIFWCGFTP